MPLRQSARVALSDHEVHKAESQMQNEELRRSHAALKAARDHYRNLYDFAPVGYLSVGVDGHVEEVNLTGAEMLGDEPSRLVGRPFAAVVSPEDGDRWHLVLREIVEQGKKQSCLVNLRRKDGSVFGSALDCVRVTDGAGPVVRIAFVDNTERKRAETRAVIRAAVVHGTPDDRAETVARLGWSPLAED